MKKLKYQEKLKWMPYEDYLKYKIYLYQATVEAIRKRTGKQFKKLEDEK